MSLFQEHYKLYYRQMVSQLHINKEMCIFHKSVHYLVHPLYVIKRYDNMSSCKVRMHDFSKNLQATLQF